MNNEYPNPWNFSNIDQNLISPNNLFKVEFGELNEISMGVPVGGECYLNFDGKKIKISEWCAGPIMWNTLSSKIALPTWTKNRNQKIVIVDTEKMTATTFKREFRIILLESFTDNFLSGVDSPIYMAEKFNFDIEKEKIEKMKELK